MLYHSRLEHHGTIFSQVDWGLLGWCKGRDGVETKVADDPAAGTVLADAMTKEEAKSSRPLRNRKGVALSLYKWLDLGNCAGLTPAVRKALNDVGQATFWDYQNRCEVIHYVCPVFPKEEMTRRRRWKC